MAKTKGFHVIIDAFLPIDKKDFDKQAETYRLMGELARTGKLPADFLTTATILTITPKEGSADLPATAADPDKPADTPLTTDHLPEGATVIEATTMLDQSVLQTVKMADGTDTLRRISADQDRAERKKNKTIPEPKTPTEMA